MPISQAMRDRHSVRQYLDKPIPENIRQALDSYVISINAAGGMHIQLIYDEPACYNTRMAHYGHFENVRNYIALVGPKGSELEEKAGYYGEMIVLKAQELGLNTCWTALSRGKSRSVILPGEKEVILISLGYGATQGSARKSKRAAQISDYAPDAPDWYREGIEAALLAPTAINQQKFRISRQGNKVAIKTSGIGPCLKIDLGIVKFHFEIGAGKDNFEWA